MGNAQCLCKIIHQIHRRAPDVGRRDDGKRFVKRRRPITRTMRRPSILLAIAALMGGCDREPPAAAPAVAATAHRPDPMLTLAIAGPIMSDQQLAHLSNRDAVRPPDLPLNAPVPPIDVVPAGSIGTAPPLPAPAGDCDLCSVARTALTLGALAERLGDPAATACAPSLRYSATWATRLPPGMPLPPAARVVEAAGSDGPGCHLRAVAYGAAVPAVAVLAGESARLARAGYRVAYAADGPLHALTARRARDGAAVRIVAQDIDGVADIRTIVTGSR